MFVTTQRGLPQRTTLSASTRARGGTISLATTSDPTGKGEDGEHVVVAVVALMMVFRPFTVTIEEVLLHVTLAVGIGVPDLIDGIVFALEGTFAEVKGYKLEGNVGDEGVAHRKNSVAPLVAGEEKVVAQSGLPFVAG